MNKTNLDWDKIDWNKIKEKVNRLQTRIVKAVRQGKERLVKRLQYLLSVSRDAKLLAVRKVTTNPGRKTAGVDGELWTTSENKLLKAMQLTSKKYNPAPLKRIYIPKKNGDMRPLGIPTMYDRAMQALYALNLDPVVEALSDLTSFGFRKWRCRQDAGAYLFNLLSRKTSAEWILEGDIKACFDKISHEWLLKYVKMNKKMLKKFLKSGYMEAGKLFPTEEGTPQGGVISPILSNIVLNGIEGMLKTKYWTNRLGTIDRQHNKRKVYLTRYADDFIITATDKGTLIEIKEMLKEFLGERGLMLSEEKTLITHIKDGFEFVGWNFRKYSNGKLIIQPSEKSIKSISDKIRETIYKGIATKAEELIDKLDSMIRGWCNQNSCMCSKEAFKRIDKVVFESLWKWAYRRHNSDKSKGWIKSRYWYRKDQRDWIFGTPKHSLRFASSIKIVRHRLVKLEANPYLPEWKEYYTDRQLMKTIDKLKAELES